MSQQEAEAFIGACFIGLLALACVGWMVWVLIALESMRRRMSQLYQVQVDTARILLGISETNAKLLGTISENIAAVVKGDETPPRDPCV